MTETQTRERIDMELLALTAAYPDLHVFNGLQLPNTGWQIDHLVVYRGVAFVITDKHWDENRTYTLTAHQSGNAGTSSYTSIALRDGETFPDNMLKPRWYENQLSLYLPDYTLRSIVMVAGQNKQVTGNYKQYRFLFLKENDLMVQLRYMLDSIGEGGPSQESQAQVISQFKQMAATGQQISMPMSLPVTPGYKPQRVTVDPSLLAAETQALLLIQAQALVENDIAELDVDEPTIEQVTPNVTRKKGFVAKLFKSIMYDPAG